MINSDTMSCQSENYLDIGISFLAATVVKVASFDEPNLEADLILKMVAVETDPPRPLS